MKLIVRNPDSQDTLEDIFKRNNVACTVEELARDVFNSTIFLYRYEKEGTTRIALELMQMAAMDDPWFMSYIWELDSPNELYDIMSMWKLMKHEIEENRKKL